MGLRYLLLIVLAINLVARIEAVSTDQAPSPLKRMLREETQLVENTESLIQAEEERGMAWDGAKMLFNGMQMKNARAQWLKDQKSPDEILNLMNIFSDTDDAFKYYSKYFTEYYNKFGNRPSFYAPRDSQTIILKRMAFWLRESKTPPQVTATLERLGPQGQYYSTLYEQMYTALQARLGGTQPQLIIRNPNYLRKN